MSSMADEYCDQLKKSFKVLYATYPPGSPVALGDFGILSGSTFIRIGDIETRFGIDVKLLESVRGSATDYTYTSQGSVDVEFRLTAQFIRDRVLAKMSRAERAARSHRSYGRNHDISNEPLHANYT
jgi:hypothetical protein